MKYFQCTLFLFALLTIITGCADSKNFESYVGREWPSEMKTWTDPEFGHEITKWTSNKYSNWHLYFNIESFIDENNAIIYSNRSGNINLFKLNMKDGSMTQLTTHNEDVGGKAWHYPQMNKLWYDVGKSIRELNYETMQNEEVVKFDDVELRSFTVTCDGKYLVYSINKNPGWTENNSTGPFAIFKYDLLTGETVQISPDYGFKISHLQASPTDPERITYAWQHQYREGGPGIVGYNPIRFWWLNVNKFEGGPVGPQVMGIHRTHEFWFYDGSRLGFSARYKFGPNTGKQYLGSCKPDGSDLFMFETPVGPAHSQVYKDNRHWVADQNDGMVLTLYTFERDKVLKEDKLFRHDSSWNGQPSHPHPHFSPEGKRIIFSTDKSGLPGIYSVKINLED